MNMPKRLAPLLALLVAFIMLFSVLYIALEADHDCCGEDCEICMQIRVCENMLRNLLTSALPVTAILCFLALFHVFADADFSAVHPNTLIALKVKLSD